MEKEGLKIASIIFERIGITEEVKSCQLLHHILMAIFTSLNFYRNNTVSKIIPMGIMRSVHSFFATVMVCGGS